MVPERRISKCKVPEVGLYFVYCFITFITTITYSNYIFICTIVLSMSASITRCLSFLRTDCQFFFNTVFPGSIVQGLVLCRYFIHTVGRRKERRGEGRREINGKTEREKVRGRESKREGGNIKK